MWIVIMPLIVIVIAVLFEICWGSKTWMKLHLAIATFFLRWIFEVPVVLSHMIISHFVPNCGFSFVGVYHLWIIGHFFWLMCFVWNLYLSCGDSIDCWVMMRCPFMFSKKKKKKKKSVQSYFNLVLHILQVELLMNKM